jgi:hypothetical protein
MKIQKKNSWYTILVTLMIIGFLIVLTTWILNLVLREMNDNRGEAKYLQTYSAAEWAMELALLQIKNKWYWIYNKIELNESNPNSKILRNDKDNKKEVLLWYDLNSKTESYTWNLESFEQVIIPLFYIDLAWTEKKVKNIKLNYSGSSSIWWNIVSKYWDWIWGNSIINNSIKWEWRKQDWSYLDKIIINWSAWFLGTYDKNYLIIVNLDSSSDLKFNLESLNNWEYFTKPVSKIISSAKIGDYKQNLETTLDNTEFLSILKYSIYSK